MLQWVINLFSRIDRKPADHRIILDMYRISLEDSKKIIEELQKAYEEQKLQIAKYKLRHPENGKELDEWGNRENHLHSIIIKLSIENRDLKEYIIFNEKLKK